MRSSRILPALVSVALVAGLVVGGASPAAAGRIPGIFGPDCPDVMVIAARGSGEQPQRQWMDAAAYAADTFHGIGKVNSDVYDRLVTAAPHLHFSLDPVEYPADGVGDLFNGSMQVFLQSVSSGADTILADLNLIENRCGGGVKYVFQGYSQGAWVIHQALWRIARTRPNFGKTVGVALFGDPLFRPNEKIVHDVYGPLLQSRGTAVAVDRSNAGVPNRVQDDTASYCFPLDLVCQANPGNIATQGPLCFAFANADLGALSPCAHYRYVTDGRTSAAANFLIPRLPAKSVWPRLTGTPRVGTVGKSYTWTATAIPTARTSYTWQPLDPPPPGLSFSDAGVLSGTPTTAGTFTFRVRATSSEDRVVSGPLSITIRPGPTAGPAAPCVQFVADVTIPDGTVLAAGSNVVKTWQLRNCGPGAWSGVNAVRVSGTAGPASFTMPAAPAGTVATVAMPLTVPTAAGSYRSTYRLVAAGGTTSSGTFWVDFTVPAPTKTVSTKYGGQFASCTADNVWTFIISDTGGIAPPTAVTAQTVGGGSVNIPLARVATDTNTAYYEGTVSAKLTGDATATIDANWNPPFPLFELITGPCRKTNMTAAVTATTVQVGSTVTLTGRLTDADGTPLAGRTGWFRWYSLTRLGKGAELGPYTTDADGRFQAEVTVDEPWRSFFVAESVESGPTQLAEMASGAGVSIWSLPPTVPDPVAGPLTSSTGTVFGPGARRTVVSGSGFEPGSDLAIAMYPNPTILATAVTDDTGAFQVEVTIPDGAAVGDHTFVAIGVAAPTEIRYLSLPVTLNG